MQAELIRKGSQLGWCGSVDWGPAWEPKGHWFNSQSGHMPGLHTRSPVWGAQEATTHWHFSPSLSPSLPPVKKINEIFLKNGRKGRQIMLPNGLSLYLYHWCTGPLWYTKNLLFLRVTDLQFSQITRALTYPFTEPSTFTQLKANGKLKVSHIKTV